MLSACVPTPLLAAYAPCRYNVTLSLVEGSPDTITVATGTPLGNCPILFEGLRAKELLA